MTDDKMNELFFSEKLYSLQKEVREFLLNELEPIKNEISQQNKIPESFIRKMGKKGFIGPLIPQKYNGTDLGMVAHCMITEEISKLNVSASVPRTPCILDGYLLNKYGNEEQKELYLKKIASGEKICSICVTEKEAGSNVAGIKSTAEKMGDSYVLNGSKKFITNAGIADYYFIWCLTNRNVNPRNGMSVFLVEKDIPGLIIENPYELMGINGIYNGTLEFKNMEISKENLIGEEGEGFQSLMDTFNVERITLSSECNGISLAALEDSKIYVKKRIQFDKPISTFQIIRLKIAEMATKLQAARLLTYSTAKLADMRKNIIKEASMAKAFSSKSAVEITSEAVQIHGGEGYTDDFSVERYMRDAKFFMIGGGTTEIQNLVIAREELK
ncbi:MAG: acyl-CoA dehydrogenase [Promethearchaeota archaeon]|nr:MAG: acyl-CoA dehydrogenase [Candidatus Lokiarchaeota archaeon]